MKLQVENIELEERAAFAEFVKDAARKYEGELWERIKYIIHFRLPNHHERKWYIDSHGTIIHSEFQPDKWRGKTIELEELLYNGLIEFTDGKRLEYSAISVQFIDQPEYRYFIERLMKDGKNE